MEEVVWCVVPFIGCLENTKETALDLLNQTAKTKVLLIDNGSKLEEWNDIRLWASAMDSNNRLVLWRHNPPLPSLAATWNRALDFVWQAGGKVAMVCNNDIRVRPEMVQLLREVVNITKGLFVSGVNHPEGYIAWQEKEAWHGVDFTSRGGPDFSCYMITKEGHAKYRFDEALIPAYMEDLDMHRQYMLGGDTDKIFSVSIPYLHKDNGSGTLKSFSPERAEAFHIAVEKGSRTYYRAKWGGGANEEKFVVPFGDMSVLIGSPFSHLALNCKQGCVTTPQLQSHKCGGGIQLYEKLEEKNQA